MAAIKLAIKVVPGASKTEISGWLGDSLKIRVAAPPEGGKANKAVLAVLADRLSLAKGQLEIVSGQTQPRKIVAIEGMDASTLATCLGK